MIGTKSQWRKRRKLKGKAKSVAQTTENLYNTPFLSGVSEEKIMEVIKVGKIKPELYKCKPPELYKCKCIHCDTELLINLNNKKDIVNHYSCGAVNYYMIICPICVHLQVYRNLDMERIEIGSTAIDSLSGGLCDNCPDEKKECAKCSFF